MFFLGVNDCVTILAVRLDHLIGVNIGVEVSHDREDDADAQQHACKQQELHPLQSETTGHE